MSGAAEARTSDLGSEILQAVLVNLTRTESQREELLPGVRTLVGHHGLFRLASKSEHCKSCPASGGPERLPTLRTAYSVRIQSTWNGRTDPPHRREAVPANSMSVQFLDLRCHIWGRPTNLVLVGIVFICPQSEFEQPVLPRVLERLVKVLVSSLRDVAQSRRIPAEVVVDAVSLHVMRKSTERSQEWQILARILSERRKVRSTDFRKRGA